MAKKTGRMKAEQAASDSPDREIVRANIHREVVPSDQFVSMYVNDTQVQVTPWDVRFIFGVIAEPPTDERRNVLIKTLGEVRMSPQHAKRVGMVVPNLHQQKNRERG